ncbi:TonB-dependent receptor [Pedobacter cryotolerans]|uniref:TonB-dependent receptor n=1 Tax=Pedobacter cryotolerans TaxID=2571270 RepID=A0A4U1BZP0_9SPHI|nr:TonB-dependent receptor [Pedobacter cryotolerans]TKB97193.1 TonB-dependent receptor [Pedobacter cryotolerans]
MFNIYQAVSFLLSYKRLLVIIILLTTIEAIAQQQNPPKNVISPLSLREVSGIVKDTTNVGIPGVTVRLTSEKDTLIMGTNPDGMFRFINVKSAVYTISVNSLGFKSFIGKYRQNDATAKIQMAPIILKADSKTLDAVVINGAPSITYKTDTVEYKASDYVVRENATVDELVKKMEGMEVGNDGSVVHQGAPIARAKINGKVYLGGDVATALQNLPAEIVEKIQIVDDYGDQAERTGIKDGDPEKILNIVTKRSKSVGNSINVTGGAGNNDRYEGSVFATRLNTNQSIGVNIRLNNTVNGVANSGNSSGNNNNGGGGRGNGGNNTPNLNAFGGSGGTTNNGTSAFSYRDQITPKIKINTNYRYAFNNTNSINSSIAQIPSIRGNTFSSNEGSSTNDTKSHNLNFELEANLDSSNFLRITPTFNYASTVAGNESSNLQRFVAAEPSPDNQSFRQDQTGNNSNRNTRPNYGITAFYQHLFAKPRRNISVQISLNNNNQEAEQDRNARILYYDGLSDLVLKDSLINRVVNRDNLTKNYRASLTFAEPLTVNTQLEFNGQINYNGYDNTAITSNIFTDGSKQIVDSLSNIYDYSFTQTRLALNYRYGVSKDSKLKFSLGVTAVPAVLSGTKESLGTSTNRSSFNLIPIARFQYLWSKQHSLQLNYSGNATEPSFDQIQPVRDVSNPQNPVVGNPDLKVTFNHSVNTSYNNYIAIAKLNYSVNANATFIENSVVRNVVQISDAFNSRKNETRFVNLNGVYRINTNHSISKQFGDRKYNLSLNGNISYNHGVSMSDNIENVTTTWNFNERFGPRINPTEWLEVNPFVSYSVIKSNNTLPSSLDSKTNTLAFNIDGKFYMWKTLIFGYSASKNYVSGINANITNNPFVINAYIEKEFYKRRAKLTFQAFDLLNQNNFVNRNILDNGAIIDTRSNALSQYFMVRLTMRLQKWSGAKPRNGDQMMRRGDGGFGRF